jgi:chromosome segregation ATPase
VNILTRLSRKPRAEVTLPLSEWHATTLAIDGLVDHNDELQHAIDQHEGVLERNGRQIATLTDERDRARRWAVHLEQETADLERVNAELRERIAGLDAGWSETVEEAAEALSKLHMHHTLGKCQACPGESGYAADEVHGVPA